MTHLRHFLALIIASLISTSPTSAQTAEELAQLDPSDLYFQGWMLARDAERLVEKEKHLDAYAKLKKAKVMFDTVAINHATYKPHLVKGRQESTRTTMEAIYEKAITEQTKNQKNDQGFIEGDGPGSALIIPVKPIDDSARLKDLGNLQGEINQLKQQLKDSINNRDADAAKLRQALADLEAERNKMATAPLRSELDALNNEIAGLRREKEALSMALSKTRVEQRKTLEKLSITQQALAESQKKERELLAVIEEQRRVNGRVVKGQQDQIDELRREMKTKDRLLSESNTKIQELTTQLKQSEGMVAELQEERDSLMLEKEQMAALLKMNEADRVQKLIEQNVSLSKNFNDAKKQVKAMTESSDATKDDIILAKRGLTVAKAKIREVQQQNKRYEIQVTDLEKRLKQANDDIVARAENGNLSEAQTEEMAMLRDIVKKQKNQITAQQKKGKLLLAQAQRMGEADPVWNQAVDQFTGSLEPVFTDEELAILDGEGPDFTATSRFKNNSADRRRAAEGLSRRTDDLNKVAGRLFSKNDLQAAKGVLGMIIEENPAAWDAMMNLGIIHLRLKEPTYAAEEFRKAILYAGNRKIPKAHSFLGECYYRDDRFVEAETELTRSLVLDPQNAQAHVLLGNIAGKMGKALESETHFKEAIQIDPNMWQPHFNLAYLSNIAGKSSQAKIYYQEALRRGAPARPDFEKKIGL